MLTSLPGDDETYQLVFIYPIEGGVQRAEKQDIKLEEGGTPRNPIQHLGSFGLLPLKLHYNLPLTLTWNPCHYQVYTFLIFANGLDKRLVCLNTENLESMHLGMKNICNFLKPFFQWDRHV